MRWNRLVVAAVVALAACGGGDQGADTATTVPGATPLTDDQAARLAQSGFANLQAGGASFEAHSAFLVGEPRESVSVYGEVDWVAHTGRVIVRADGVDAGVTEVYWTKEALFERRPAMDTLVAARGGPSQPWIARPPEPAARQLDRLIALVAALASEQPDNALLIQQTEGSAFVRDDVLREVPVEVLRYGTRNLYWLNRADGLLMRFEGNSAGGTAPTIIDILERRAVGVAPPPSADVVPAEALGELYQAFAGG